MKRAMILGVCLAAGLARAERPFGAALAPAMLPSGSTAVWGFTGAPAIGVGFRQGLGSLELDAQAGFDYFDATLSGALDARFRVFASDGFELAPFAGLGFAWDPGATYANADNFFYSAVRLHFGVVASWALTERLAAIGTAELAWDVFTHPTPGYRVEPLAGGGLEVGIASGVSVLALGELGVDLRKRPGADVQSRLGYAVRVGLGFRLF